MTNLEIIYDFLLKIKSNCIKSKCPTCEFKSKFSNCLIEDIKNSTNEEIMELINKNLKESK